MEIQLTRKQREGISRVIGLVSGIFGGVFVEAAIQGFTTTIIIGLGILISVAFYSSFVLIKDEIEYNLG